MYGSNKNKANSKEELVKYTSANCSWNSVQANNSACHTRKFFLAPDLSYSPNSLAVLPVNLSSSLLMSSSSLFGLVLSIRYGSVIGSPTVKARTLYPETGETKFYQKLIVNIKPFQIYWSFHEKQI